MLVSPTATSVTSCHLSLFILPKLTLRLARLAEKKMSGVSYPELCRFLVRQAARIVFASERIRVLALRQFDVNCSRELDVLCNFAFQR